jgi:hypothetical protein
VRDLRLLGREPSRPRTVARGAGARRARPERPHRRGDPATVDRAPHPGREPGERARSRQDHAARADDQRSGSRREPRRDRRPADPGDRGRSGDHARRRAHPGRGGPRAPDQHRQGVPPGRGDGGVRAGGDGPARAVGGHDRERGQPGLPRAVRPGGARPRGDRVGRRGRRQADQVPAHVPVRRSDAAQQGGPAALRGLRSGPVSRRPAPGESPPARAAGVGHARRRARGLVRLAAERAPAPGPDGPSRLTGRYDRRSGPGPG